MRFECWGLEPVNAEELFASELSWMKQLAMIEESKEGISLTDRGAFFADEVTTQFFNPRLPFGGIKDSGFGRELCRHGMLAFCNPKTLCFG